MTWSSSFQGGQSLLLSLPFCDYSASAAFYSDGLGETCRPRKLCGAFLLKGVQTGSLSTAYRRWSKFREWIAAPWQAQARTASSGESYGSLFTQLSGG